MTPARRLGIAALLLVIAVSRGGCGIPGLPVASGERSVVIAYETADVTPAFSRVLNGLRSGAHAEYLKSKGHVLDLIDFDAATATGKKAALLEKYGAEIKHKRNLIVAEKASGRLLTNAELTDSHTAADVIEHIKQSGG